jgi:asparagine synthase (glutamine-hydrolysing)
VTVVLSGEGADEILAGYYIYKKMLMIERFRQLPSFLRENILLTLISIILKTEKQRNYIALARLPLEERYTGVSRAFPLTAVERLYKLDNKHDEALKELFRSYFGKVEKLDPLNKMLFVDMKTWLPDDLLIKADKMTMATSQELRVPFLDHKVVEFAFSLPPQFKLHKSITKILLKNLAKDILPEPIINRDKKGFPIPISHWFKGDLHDFARGVLLDSSSACSEYFAASYIELLLDTHRDGRQDYSEAIWNLLFFEYWYNTFIKAKGLGNHYLP